MPKKGKADAAKDEIVFGDEIDAAVVPSRGSSTKYDAVVAKAQRLAIGRAFSFQANTTSSLTRLKKQLANMGYALTTRTNPDSAPVNPGGVTAFVVNNVGDGVEPITDAS